MRGEHLGFTSQYKEFFTVFVCKDGLLSCEFYKSCRMFHFSRMVKSHETVDQKGLLYRDETIMLRENEMDKCLHQYTGIALKERPILY